jgi:hypothetical protein
LSAPEEREEKKMSDQMPDAYDRLLGALDGLPDVVQSRPTTIRLTTPLLGNSQTFIVQTVRQKDKGDTIFLEVVSREGSQRIAIPPGVANAIARQRDALTAKSRSKAARAQAQDRKDRGVVPFLKKEAV